MTVVFLVLPLALLVVLVAVFAYTWAVRRGQFDDLTTPAMRMLHDDDEDGDASRRKAEKTAEDERSKTEEDAGGRTSERSRDSSPDPKQ